MPNTLSTLNDGYIHSIRENTSPVKPKFKSVVNAYEKKKDFSQRTSSITVPSVLNDPSFFDNSIYQKTSVVNVSEEIFYPIKSLKTSSKNTLFSITTKEKGVSCQ